MTNPEKRCPHTDKHPYRSVADCKALESLEKGIWAFSLDFLDVLDPRSSHSSDEGPIFTNSGDYRRVLRYVERLENDLMVKGKALDVVSEFIKTPSDQSSDAATPRERNRDEHQGHAAAREHLFKLLRPHLHVLSQDRLEKPSALDPEKEADADECRPVIEHVQQLEKLLKTSDEALEIVSEFAGPRQRSELQKEQLAVTDGNPRADGRKRELQGKIDARKDLSHQLSSIGE